MTHEKKKTNVKISEHKKSSFTAFSRSPVIWLVIPSVLLAVAAVVVVIVEFWLAGPAVTQPLVLPLVIDRNMTSSTEYLKRTWGSYR